MNLGISDTIGSTTSEQNIGMLLHEKLVYYSYIPMLLAKIFTWRKNDCGSTQDYMEMSLNDPRRIAPTTAATDPLPTSELVPRHRSRFSS